MRIILSFFSSLLLISTTISQSAIQLRIVGGTLEDRGYVIIPEPSGGAYALGTTSSHGDGTVRGYVVYYDSDFQYSWSILTPYGPVVERLVDGVNHPDSPNDNILVLAQCLGDNGTYNAVVHNIDNTSEIISTLELSHPENQNPQALVNWRGSVYAIGDMHGDGWWVDINDSSSVDSETFTTWGHFLQTEAVTSAKVFNDTLYVAGSTEIDGVLQTTIWAWGPDGNPIWARISPNEELEGNNYATDIAVTDNFVTLLYSFDRPGLPIGQGLVYLNPSNGTPGSILDTSGSFYADGRRLIFRDDKLFKLSHINTYSGEGTDIGIVQLEEYGGFEESSVLGTSFNEIASDMEIDEEGRMWIIGTTYGYLNGTSSICVYRFDSTQVIGNEVNLPTDLSITNDPMLYFSVGINENPSSLVVYPNPARRGSVVSLSAQAEWMLYSSVGTLIRSGFGDLITLDQISSGTYILRTSLNGITRNNSLQIVE
tara:strand:- start:2597 stop:4045 length:1449 start_codon:yes stop_codon:yes gene_type:complete